MRLVKLFMIVLLLSTVSGLGGCVTGYQLANRFVIYETDLHVLLLPPTQLTKTFLPLHPDSINDGTIPDYDESDIRFINRTDDSLYISEFFKGLRERLDRLDINVYGVEDIDAFFEIEKSAYIFVVAQLELLEYLHTETYLARDRTTNYVYREQVRFLENNVWFEFINLDDPDFDIEVLFSVQATSDYIDWRFIRRVSGEVVFDADRYLLTEDDVKDLAFFAGQQNGQHIFDHLMNLYVQERLSHDPVWYYEYDMERHVIRETDTPGFIRIEQEPVHAD